MPLQLWHSFLYIGTIIFFFELSGISCAFQTFLIILFTHCISIGPTAFIISAITSTPPMGILRK
jgi:hypothetical protein